MELSATEKFLTEKHFPILDEGCQIGEETMGITSYCALKYRSNFRKAIVIAVNYDGGNDRISAVSGNILGAHGGERNGGNSSAVDGTCEIEGNSESLRPIERKRSVCC